MFANKVMQPITNVGTGAFQLDPNGTGSWKTWRSQFATAAQVAYYAENEAGTEWEFGYGTLTHGTPDQISRTVILSSTGSTIDWTSGDGTVYVMSVPWAQAMEGRWDTTAAMFVSAGRRPFTAVGAANKTVTAADAAGRFSLDNSAAARTVTLPLISAVPMGFHVEVYGLSSANLLNITPSGTDTIDGGAAGATLAVSPGNSVINIISDGTGWRTNYRVPITQAAANNSNSVATTAYADRTAIQQIVSTVTGAVATGTTTIPFDDTIPQNTEGDQYMSLSITPKSATSTLEISVVWNGSTTGAGSVVTVALFQDTTVNALAVSFHNNAGTTAPICLPLKYTMTSGTTSATTFKVRAGSNVANTTTFNGQSGGRIYGGKLASSIVIREIGV